MSRILSTGEGGVRGGGGMHGRGACVACMAGGGVGHVCHACPPGRYYGHGIRSMSGQYASYWNAFLLPPAMKLGKGYIFTGICDSIHRGGAWSGGVCSWGEGVPGPGGVCFRGGVPGGGTSGICCLVVSGLDQMIQTSCYKRITIILLHCIYCYIVYTATLYILLHCIYCYIVRTIHAVPTTQVFASFNT